MSLGKRKLSRVYLSIGAIAISAIITVAVFTITGNGNASSSSVISKIQVGAAAPSFTLDSARGGSYDLDEFRGEPVVLSFIDGTEQSAGTLNKEFSISEIVFLRSMQNQYSDKGVKILTIDSSYLTKRKSADVNSLINFTYDMNMGDIPLLIDNGSNKVANKYGVTKLPTTFVISSGGIITQRFDGLALTSQLASSIDALLSSSDSTPENISVTPAQPIFQGFDSARPLSEDIWVVDGGQNWASGTGFPVRWLSLNATGAITIRVTAKNTATGEEYDLADQKMDKIPSSEAKKILTNLPDASPDKLYTLIDQVKIPVSGIYQIHADIIDSNQKVVLSRDMVIYAK